MSSDELGKVEKSLPRGHNKILLRVALRKEILGITAGWDQRDPGVWKVRICSQTYSDRIPIQKREIERQKTERQYFIISLKGKIKTTHT